jgi:hypothetical protein
MEMGENIKMPLYHKKIIIILMGHHESVRHPGYSLEGHFFLSKINNNILFKRVSEVF